MRKTEAEEGEEGNDCLFFAHSVVDTSGSQFLNPHKTLLCGLKK